MRTYEWFLATTAPAVRISRGVVRPVRRRSAGSAPPQDVASRSRELRRPAGWQAASRSASSSASASPAAQQTKGELHSETKIVEVLRHVARCAQGPRQRACGKLDEAARTEVADAQAVPLLHDAGFQPKVAEVVGRLR